MLSLPQETLRNGDASSKDAGLQGPTVEPADQGTTSQALAMMADAQLDARPATEVARSGEADGGFPDLTGNEVEPEANGGFPLMPAPLPGRQTSAPTAPIDPAVTVIGRQTQVEEDAEVAGAIIWPNSRISREAVVRYAIVGRNCHIGRNVSVEPGAVLGDKTTLTDYTKA